MVWIELLVKCCKHTWLGMAKVKDESQSLLHQIRDLIYFHGSANSNFILRVGTIVPQRLIDSIPFTLAQATRSAALHV